MSNGMDSAGGRPYELHMTAPNCKASVKLLEKDDAMRGNKDRGEWIRHVLGKMMQSCRSGHKYSGYNRYHYTGSNLHHGERYVQI
ncbi:hypothetical protein SCLCIDRAFT_1224485 [Scleroderma citrinum Foug A]|uniref:Uncharacterized protein n=1 Tax=Scleroderma citrinum Foug A TaxID=1036808 RepID=A0A0C2ZEX5_9AGAM|nr:hypothetical protein SCLCIDRAFT_1224485 [Scleroderma citrinum Foug A]